MKAERQEEYLLRERLIIWWREICIFRMWSAFRRARAMRWTMFRGSREERETVWYRLTKKENITMGSETSSKRKVWWIWIWSLINIRKNCFRLISRHILTRRSTVRLLRQTVWREKRSIWQRIVITTVWWNFAERRQVCLCLLRSLISTMFRTLTEDWRTLFRSDGHSRWKMKRSSWFLRKIKVTGSRFFLRRCREYIKERINHIRIWSGRSSEEVLSIIKRWII